MRSQQATVLAARGQAEMVGANVVWCQQQEQQPSYWLEALNTHELKPVAKADAAYVPASLCHNDCYHDRNHWNKLGDMPAAVAMQQYIETLSNVDPAWQQQQAGQSSSRSSGGAMRQRQGGAGGPVFSRMRGDPAAEQQQQVRRTACSLAVHTLASCAGLIVLLLTLQDRCWQLVALQLQNTSQHTGASASCVWPVSICRSLRQMYSAHCLVSC